LERVLVGREIALSGLEQAVAAGERAGEWQRLGDLMLAYGPSAPVGSTEVDAWDYEGNPVTLEIDPDLGWKGSAERLFRRARKAKSRLDEVREQGRRIAAERDRVEAALGRVESLETLSDLESLRTEARANRWLHGPTVVAGKVEARPYDGHRIRELVAPGGWTVLYGENAEANDYLTLRVARSNDFWLHVRGGTSAHVVVQTRNQPDRVQKETLEFAARTAIRNSPSKHSGYVSVDYTLKKYVRKPKGAPKGSALYTHERTLNIQAD
jgi:predicted ribosome quality control (RQC) complex YloA/Tae2 family protein